MLKKVETLAKVNKDTAFDEEVMDLKIMLEEQIPKGDKIEFQMIFKDIENVNFGTNPALLNDKPKIVSINTYNTKNRNEEEDTIMLRNHLRKH